MNLRRTTTAACGALLLAMTAAAVPGSAQAVDREHYTNAGTGPLPDFCGSGVTMHYDFTEWGSFLAHPFGRDGLWYGQVATHLTNTITNPVNHKSIKHVLDALNKDATVTDNGDGTLTIRTKWVGGDRWYDASGHPVILDSGGQWSDLLIDDGGTPTDPSDDEFISSSPNLKETGQELNLTDANFCAEILAVIG
jgi:hypothetical protein